jgi:hypothetical protein
MKTPKATTLMDTNAFVVEIPMFLRNIHFSYTSLCKKNHRLFLRLFLPVFAASIAVFRLNPSSPPCYVLRRPNRRVDGTNLEHEESQRNILSNPQTDSWYERFSGKFQLSVECKGWCFLHDFQRNQ